MAELKIPIPTSATGRIPQSISYAWCQKLHEAMQPLLRYKLADGSDAIKIFIAAGPTEAIFLKRPWKINKES